MAAAGWFFFFIGCASQDDSALYPAVGRVQLANGQGVGDAVIVFTPSGTSGESRMASQAQTDGEGLFQMETYVGDNQYELGIPAGKYDVAVTKLEAVTDMRTRPRNLLPAKYESPDTTDLHAHVRERDDNEFSFQLKLD